MHLFYLTPLVYHTCLGNCLGMFALLVVLLPFLMMLVPISFPLMF